MYPGQRYHSSSSQSHSQGYQQQNTGQWGPPPGPPPMMGYGPPPGPPPGMGYGPPPGPPPQFQNGYQQQQQGQYQRPSNPPPSQQSQYQRPAQPPQQQHQSSSSSHGYSRPSAPPPGYASNGNGQTRQYANVGAATQHRPPSQPQMMGNTGMSYQYSQCTGKRKALLIGINYIGTKSALRGCINDANAMRRFLIDKFGYKAEDMVMLTDDQREMVKVPTRANIIRAMQWLVADASPNDSLVFHYSGHGGLVKNTTGDEESGYDSCIYPVDYQTAGSIIDDVMHQILIKPLPQGARLTAFFDSCHSGSALDLPFVYSTKGVIKEPNVWKDVGSSGLSAVMSYAQGNISGMVSSLSSAVKKATGSGYDRQQAIAKNTSPADVIMISGSKDEQTSADATTNGISTGAMSYAFINVMAQNSNQSYISLLNNMRAAMSGKYSQKPQLSSSHPIDVNLRFIM